MKATNKILLVFTVLTALIGLAFNAGAQNTAAQNAAVQDDSSSMQVLVEKLRADKKLLVSENMQLSEEEAKAFWPVYTAYQDELIAIQKRSVKMIKDYSDAYSNMTSDIAKKLLDEMISIDSSLLKLRQDYLPKFRKVLPEAKVARYYQIENKIRASTNYDLAAGIPLIK
jgi:galactose-1-phosphate uridylyltransferase